MNNIQELMKTKPEMFDFPDCSAGGSYPDDLSAEMEEHLPDQLKQALAAARAKKQPDQSAQPV